MAGKLFVVLFAVLAVQGWTSAGVIPDEILDLLEDSDFSDLEIFGDLPQEVFDGFVGDDVAVKSDPKNCLPHVQGAYDAAVQVRQIIRQGRELAGKLKEALKKCRALTTPEEKKKCYQDVRKQAIEAGKPLKDAYLKVRPTVIDLMGKFDQCMA